MAASVPLSSRLEANLGDRSHLRPVLEPSSLRAGAILSLLRAAFRSSGGRLGAFWKPFGTLQGAFWGISDASWGPFGTLFWAPKSSNIDSIFKLNLSTAVERHVCPSGGRRGSFCVPIRAPFWIILGSIWGSPAQPPNGSGNSLRCHASSKGVLGASWGPLGLDY